MPTIIKKILLNGHCQKLACWRAFYFFLQQLAATPSNIVGGIIEMVK